MQYKLTGNFLAGIKYCFETTYECDCWECTEEDCIEGDLISYDFDNCLESAFSEISDWYKLYCTITFIKNIPDFVQTYIDEISKLFKINFENDENIGEQFQNLSHLVLFLTVLRYGLAVPFTIDNTSSLFYPTYFSFKRRNRSEIWKAFQLANFYTSLNGHGANHNFTIDLCELSHKYFSEDEADECITKLISLKELDRIIKEDNNISELDRDFKTVTCKEADKLFEKLCGTMEKSVVKNSEYAGNSC